MKFGDFVYLILVGLVPISLHSLNALVQGVLNIHALIEGHTRFETKKARLKQTINSYIVFRVSYRNAQKRPDLNKQ